MPAADKREDIEKIEAEAAAKVKILEARAKLSGSAQAVYAIADVLGGFFENVLGWVGYIIAALIVFWIVVGILGFFGTAVSGIFSLIAWVFHALVSLAVSS